MTTESRPGLRRAFAALKHENYRWYFLSGMGMSAAQGIQDLALAWLVLDLTGSLSTLGFVVFARGLPMLVLGLFGGVFADRYSRRNLLIANQTVTMVNMGAIAFLVFTDAAEVWQIYVSSVLLGLTVAITGPARTALIRGLVPREDMLNAVALNSFQMNLSRIIWPTMAGGLIALVGSGGAFAICAVASAFGIVFMFPVRDTAERLASGRNTSALADVIDGLKYTASIPVLAMIMALIMAVGMFGLTFQIMATAFAREVMHFSAGEAGLFLMAGGIGSLIGSSALLVIEVKNRNRLFLQSVAGFGVGMLLIALNPTYAGAFVLMAIWGVFNSSTPVMAQTIFQVAVPQHYLGRVNSLFMIAPGLAAMLTLPIGVIGDAIGLRWSLAGIALIVIAVSAAGAAMNLHNRPLPEADAEPMAAGAQPAKGIA